MLDFESSEVVASAIVDKYIGESARIIREMFGYAKEHQPCIIFMDARSAISDLTLFLCNLCFFVAILTPWFVHGRTPLKVLV